MAGRERGNALDNGFRLANGAETEVLGQRDFVQLTSHASAGQNGAYFRAKHHPAFAQGVVKRLDPQSVARQKELLLAGVPDGEREHSPEVLRAGGAPAAISL